MGCWNREEILAILDELRSLDPGCELFGYPGRHGYTMNPPAEEAEVEAFENRYGITLPQEYREFLITVGNGGLGPAYGILSLAESEKELIRSLKALEIDSAGFLAQPFAKPACLDDAPEYYVAPGMLPVCELGSGLCIHLCVSGTERGC